MALGCPATPHSSKPISSGPTSRSAAPAQSCSLPLPQHRSHRLPSIVSGGFSYSSSSSSAGKASCAHTTQFFLRCTTLVTLWKLFSELRSDISSRTRHLPCVHPLRHTTPLLPLAVPPASLIVSSSAPQRRSLGSTLGPL